MNKNRVLLRRFCDTPSGSVSSANEEGSEWEGDPLEDFPAITIFRGSLDFRCPLVYGRVQYSTN